MKKMQLFKIVAFCVLFQMATAIEASSGVNDTDIDSTADNEIEPLSDESFDQLSEDQIKLMMNDMDLSNQTIEQLTELLDEADEKIGRHLVNRSASSFDLKPIRSMPMLMNSKMEAQASYLKPKRVRAPEEVRRRRRGGGGRRRGKGKGRRRPGRRHNRYCLRHGYQHHLCNKHCHYRPRTTCSTSTTTVATTLTESTTEESTTESTEPTSTSTTETPTSTEPPTSPTPITITTTVLVYDSVCSWKRHLIGKLQQLLFHIEANRPVRYSYYANVLHKTLESLSCVCRCKDMPLAKQMRLLFRTQHVYNRIGAKFEDNWQPTHCRLKGVQFLCGTFKSKV